MPKQSTCTEWSITRSTGNQRIDLLRIAAEPLHGAAHGGQVDDARHAGEVLQHDAGRLERNLDFGRLRRLPAGQAACTSSSVTS